MTRSAPIALALSLALAGCPSSAAPSDAATGGNDTGTSPDATTTDVGAGQDANVPDANLGTDAGADACGAAGTYDVVWTAGSGNDEACTAPGATVTILSDGFDADFRACPTGCDTTCTRVPLDASCVATGSVTGPCSGLPEGRSLSLRYEYAGDGTAEFTFGSVMPDCAYTGAGTQR